ncbi:hypothetical protein ACFX14_022818 [Malus domestica]
MLAGRGQELAQHGPIRWYGRGHNLGCSAWLEPRAGLTWAKEVAWQGPRFRLPHLCYLLRRRKLLEFDFSIAVNGVIEDKATKIIAVECEVAAEGMMATREPKVIQACVDFDDLRISLSIC